MTQDHDPVSPEAPPARQGLLGGGIAVLWSEAWPVVVLTAILGLVFLGQEVGRALGQEQAILVLGSLFRPGLEAGIWWTPVTHIFLHGSWLHLIMNCGALIALGPGIAQRLGRDALGGLLFLGFFLVCGLAGAVAFLGLHGQDPVPMLGASGAICGLWGASARLTGPGRAELAPVLSRPVARQAGSFIMMNLVIVALGATFGLVSGAGVIGIAWEAHLGGFLAGLLLISVLPVRFWWLKARSPQG